MHVYPNVSYLRWYLGTYPAIILLFHLFNFEKEAKLKIVWFFAQNSVKHPFFEKCNF